MLLSVNAEKLFQFLQHIYKQENELVKIYQDITFGYTLCSLIEKEEQVENIKLKDFVIYLDSNFILRLLDLQEPYYTNETKELLNLLNQCGAKIKVFDETVQEVASVLEFYKDRYSREKDEVNSICEASNIDGVYGAFYRKALTISQIDDIIDDLSNALKMLNIFTDTISRYKIEPNTTEVDNLYIWKYGENDNKDKDYKYAKCKNYISIIEIIKYLRKTHGVYARNFANSKYIFLTCDWKLYRYNKSGRNPKVRYPEIIIQEAIVDTLMLFFPEQYEGIATELVLSVYQASRFLNVQVLNSFADNVKSIIKEDPTLTQYVLKAVRNVENYDDISKLYKEDEENAISGLKQLIEEQKKRDDEKAIVEQNKAQEAFGAQYKKGRREGHENICRQIAKQKFKKYQAVKFGATIAAIIIPLIIIVLILTKVIDTTSWNINPVAQWIITGLVGMVWEIITVVIVKSIKVSEDSIYQKLLEKYEITDK